MLVEVVYLLLTRQVAVTCQSDDLHTWSHYEECHVETYLVVAGTGRTVSDGISTYLVSVACDGDSLEDTLRRHRDRIAVVTQHVAVHHVLQRLLVILLCHVESDILHCAQLVGVLLVGLQLLGRETTGVSASGIYLITVLCKFHHCVRGVQTSTESYYYFFLHNIILFFSISRYYVIALFRYFVITLFRHFVITLFRYIVITRKRGLNIRTLFLFP